MDTPTVCMPGTGALIHHKSCSQSPLHDGLQQHKLIKSEVLLSSFYVHFSF
jgi:hypothetical protein